MSKRIFSGGSSGKRGFPGGFASGGYYVVDFLGTVPDQASMLLLTGDKGDWCIRSDLNTVFIIIAEPPSLIGNWQQLAYPTDPAKVLCDTLDPGAPGYLYDKMNPASASIAITIVGALNHLVNLELRPFVPTGAVIEIYDNTVALPVLPSTGDRYIALVTANGWTKDTIYEWTGAVWQPTAPVSGMFAVIANIDRIYQYLSSSGWTDIGVPLAHASTHDVGGADEVFPMFYKPVKTAYDTTGGLPVAPVTGDRYICGFDAGFGWTFGHIYEWSGSAWVDTTPRTGSSVLVIGNQPAPHATAAIVGGAVYAWTGATWAISKYSGTVLLDANDNYGSGFLLEKLWGNDGVVVQTSVPDGRIRLDANIDAVTIDLVGATPKKIAVKDLGITDAKVSATAAIVESKLALSYPTHSNANDPSSGEKAALAGTNGTPGAGNKYVTDTDTRNANARTPTAHASSHNAGGGDVMAIDAAAGTGSLRTLGTGATAAAAGNHGHTMTDTREKTFYNPSGLTATVNALVFRVPWAAGMTVTKIQGRRVGGTSCTINARKNGASNHLGSALSLAAADTWYSNASINNASYSTDDWLEVMIVTVGGSPTQVQIQVEFTRAI